ncbi:class I SAM-dependent methyltransferase [Iamia sp. SCSIO 61187]|uniref:class I SAM-dependent methyltransferase n=1 Tax=Iamia sp. SCSIO 61187 TaxID=2722752 RepID=UPI001C62D8CD|nr:class I SAM-dependent methyltransferase [Iamia sp. SCSIO 61187]QYG93428.1 class I SAM-dependent methyltransferase [Iamia sp. SCSIO 61187]
MSHDHDAPDLDLDELFSPTFWDERYGGVERTWSGRPNQRLVEVVEGMTPGRALDLGAGEGGDAAWLAQQGWRVTALDASQVALDRAARFVADDRVTWRQADLRTWTPEPGLEVDLATMCFLHLPHPHHGRLIAQLAAVVRPGGTMVHLSHHRDDIAVGRWDMPDVMRPAAEIAADLDAAVWEVVRADDPTRMEPRHGHHGHGAGDDHEPHGELVQVRDTVVVARRR